MGVLMRDFGDCCGERKMAFSKSKIIFQTSISKCTYFGQKNLCFNFYFAVPNGWFILFDPHVFPLFPKKLDGLAASE